MIRISKNVRHAAFSVVALIVLFAAAGTAYTLFAGPGEIKKAPVAAAKTEPDAVPKPKAPAPNAPEGVAIGSLTSPVTAGSNASITVRTNPTSVCTISVLYNGAASTDSGLSSKTADAYGVAGWTWTVGAGVPPGSWPIKVTCSYNGRSAVFDTNIQVVK